MSGLFKGLYVETVTKEGTFPIEFSRDISVSFSYLK
jgi:hypothetical protein